MKSNLLFLFSILFFSISAQQKEVIYSINEDYDKPHFTHWSVSDEFNKREVVNGVYTAKSLTTLGPKLTFEHNINQFNCVYSSEMEFTLKKIKGSEEAFIGVEFSVQANSGPSNSPRFVFNGLGAWILYKDNKIEKASGTIAVNKVENVLKVVFNKSYMEFYLNDLLVVEHKLYESNQLRWKDIIIFGDKKTVIGLDKLVLIAYYDDENPDISSYEAERFMNNITSVGYLRGFVLRQENKKYRYVTLRGRISEIEFDGYTSAGTGPLVRIEMKEPERYGYLDQNGKVIYTAEFSYAASSPCNEADTDCFVGFYKVKDKEGNILFVNEVGEQKRN